MVLPYINMNPPRVYTGVHPFNKKLSNFWGEGEDLLPEKERKKKKRNASKDCFPDVTWAALKDSNFGVSLICRDGKVDRGTASHSLDVRRCTPFPCPAIPLHCPLLTRFTPFNNNQVIFLTNFAKDILKKAKPSLTPCVIFSSYPTRTIREDLHTKGLPVPRKVPLTNPLMILWLNDAHGRPFPGGFVKESW